MEEQQNPTTTTTTIPDHISTANSDQSDSDSDSDFEFPFVTRDSSDITADEIFADGQIRPLYYPVFGRPVPSSPPPPRKSASPSRLPLGKLFLEDRSSSTGSTSSSSSAVADQESSDTAELDGVPDDSYCLWSPASSASASPARKQKLQPKKSGSTGSVARWRRISEMVVGRSHSDGKEKFMFLSAPPAKDSHQEKKEKVTAKDKSSSNNNKANEVYNVPAHRILYGHASSDQKRRTTFLPYRPELVGLFANVNGLSRSHHPF